SGLSLSNPKSITVASVTFTLSDILLANPGGGSTSDAEIELQGNMSIPDLVGLKVGVDGSNFVVINENGVSLTGVDASITGNFSAFGLTMQPTNLAIAYTPTGDTFTVSGDLQISTPDSSLINVNGNLGTPTKPGLTVASGK